jgi:hypothetical protein
MSTLKINFNTNKNRIHNFDVHTGWGKQIKLLIHVIIFALWSDSFSLPVYSVTDWAQFSPLSLAHAQLGP